MAATMAPRREDDIAPPQRRAAVRWAFGLAVAAGVTALGPAILLMRMSAKWAYVGEAGSSEVSDDGRLLGGLWLVAALLALAAAVAVRDSPRDGVILTAAAFVVGWLAILVVGPDLYVYMDYVDYDRPSQMAFSTRFTGEVNALLWLCASVMLVGSCVCALRASRG